MWPDNMVPFLKYGHSPGSPSTCVSGRLPAQRLGQLGLQTNPSLSSLSVALLSSPRHFSTGSSWLDIDSTTASATRFLSPIMCKTSAHEAQLAACAQRTADLNPRPPILMGNVCDVSCVRCILVWDLSQQRARCFPQAFIVRQNVSADIAGGRVRNVWLASWVGALQQDLPTAGTLGIPCHNRSPY